MALNNKKNIKKVRLDALVKPERYQIVIKPDLEAFVFEGEETISLTLGKDVKKITLHSIELEILSAEIIKDKEKTFALKITYDEDAQTSTFLFPKNIEKGKVKLKLVFRGILNDRMHGFYRSRYEIDGKTYYLATSQFEATDARRAFPCFDEPAQKAIFEVKLIVPEIMTAISNTMPTVVREHEAGYKIVEFAPTPLMSTYLLAFIVGNLEHVERKTKEGVLVRVFATPGKIHQAEFALDCATKMLSFFGEYFDIPYPLPVLDMIAIPDFASGAMENWGAITYREVALLIDPDHSSAVMKQRVATVIAHELSHQWFGNLVTMEWWTHLWLNEGFASYIEYLAVDHVFPEWDMWTEFVSGDLDTALDLDALKHTHPIEVEVHHPDDISEIFDMVSYAKGASVIRMLADYLGEKDFRDGLRYYLKKHSYKNTETIHLWQAFEKVSKKPISKMMGVWTGKAGYPLLTLSQKNNVLKVEQARFFASPISKGTTKDKTVWPIPLNIQNKTSTKKVMLDTKKMEIEHGSNEWIKLNASEIGVFRTNYTLELWGALAHAVEHGELSLRDRLGLVRDVFDLAYAGELSAVQALDFVSAYKNETNYAVWGEILSGLNRVYRLIERDACAPLFRQYALGILEPMVEKVGWSKKETDEHIDILLRSLILGSAGVFGNEKVVERAQKMFQSIKKGENPVPPDLRGVVYGTVARHGEGVEHAKMIEMYKTLTLHEEKNRIGAALGYFKDKELLQKTLDFSISEYVRSQDMMRFTGIVAGNSFGREIVWKFTKKNWNFILERYGGQKDLPYFIEPFSSFQTEKDADDIEKFFSKNPAPGAARAIEQTLERIRAKVLWVARDKKNIASWLRKKK